VLGEFVPADEVGIAVACAPDDSSAALSHQQRPMRSRGVSGSGRV
jgi:hypothetical protein